MRRIQLFGLTAACCLMAVSVSAQEVLVTVDLSVENEITLTATDGLAFADRSGSTFTGFLLADFFPGNGPGFVDSLGGVGDLCTANDVSDGSPGIFNSAGNDGLNVWAYAAGDSSFTAGSLGCTGSATWTLDPDDYAAALKSNATGEVFFPADTDDDIGAATLVGAWELATTTECTNEIGDVDGNGSVGLSDIPVFVDLLATSGYQCEADIDQDKDVDLEDIPLFVTLLSGG